MTNRPASEREELIRYLLEEEEIEYSSSQILPRAGGAEVPLSYTQERLWFLHHLETGQAAYNIPFAVRIHGLVDLEMLQKSFNEVVRRHEVLRTSFPARDGIPYQRIAPSLTLTVQVENFAAEEGDKSKIALQLEEEATRSFDVANGPLVRLRVLKVSEEECVVLWTMHHLVSDGWSTALLIEEISSLYGNFIKGAESDLEDLAIQYGDYAAWQRGWLQGSVLEEQLDYWREQLKGLSGALELPTDRPRFSVKRLRGACLQGGLEMDLTRKLQELARRENATLFMLLMAVFQVLLWKYTGQEDIAVGTPIANRTRPEIEKLIGLFMNTLVMRTMIDRRQGFLHFLRHVKATALAAYQHQDVPFEKVVEELNPERDLSRSPLFQVMFVQQNVPHRDLTLSGLNLEIIEAEGMIPKFDLTLTAFEDESGIGMSIEYDSSLFLEESIDRMAAHWKRLLESVVARPESRLADLSVLSDTERIEILQTWNKTEKWYPRDKQLSELFQEQVTKTPDATAVVFEDQKLSYVELNRRANQLAHYLRKKEMHREQVVGICMERSLEMIVAILGVLKAGGAYLPLDPEYPQDRLRYMIEDSQAPLLLIQEKLLRVVENIAVDMVCLDRSWEQIASEPESNLDVEESDGNLAYVIYTSGSSGRPKGVMISHQSILYRLWWTIQHFPMGADDAVLQKTTFSFDASVWEIFVPLLTGARLVMAEPRGERDSRYLVEAIQKHRITVLQLVPSMLGVFLREHGVERCAASLKQVFSGGEALDTELFERFRNKLGRVRLQNLYGPTEASIDAASWPCEQLEEQRYVPLGRPLTNAQIYILDEDLEAVPIGVAGEIYIGGAGLARGYIGNPQLTAERFIPGPHSGRAGERIYQTGDRGRFRGNGVIEYLGRTDAQVKIRGYRIELGEIEAVLGECPGVTQCVVVVREELPGDKRLVAYVVLEQGQARPEINHLEEELRRKLPEYMVPGAVVPLERMPLTPNGKLDRNALPEAGREPVNEYVKPRTATEAVLAQIWASVLKVEKLGVQDNFFMLGGHSLLAMQLMARVQEVFQIDIPLRRLFEHWTVEGLAKVIGASLGGGGAIWSGPIPRRAPGGKKQVSYAQQRLLFLDRLEPNSAFYNVAASLKMEGKLDVGALERSLNEVIRRHEALRTRFVAGTEGEPEQEVMEAMEVNLVVREVEGEDRDRKWSEVTRLSREEAQQPFNLSVGPLLRAGLLRVGPEEHVALLTMHHIVSDEWSMGVLIDEMGYLYRAYSEGWEPQLEELPIQYGDYAAWQREWLQGEALEKQLVYWRKQLEGMNGALELPVDHPRPPAQTFRGSHYIVNLDEELGRKLQELARRENVTLFMLLIAAFQVLVSKYSKQEDIALGTPIANRTRRETENLIGFFLNTLVLRTKIDVCESFLGLLQNVREVALGAYAHQDISFEKLVEELKPKRDPSRSPFFQVMFALQNVPRKKLELTNLKLSAWPDDLPVSKFDLTVVTEEVGSCLHSAWEYNSDLFEKHTIVRMAGHWQELLRAIVAAPETRVSELAFLTAGERSQIAYEWNQTGARYEARNLVELFEEQVDRSPGAVAVEDETEELSYAALNDKANQMGRYLQKLGVGPEVLVGICMERSVAMVVGLLGILKAGGAYVPLDPGYPEERLRYMIEDSGVKVLLVQEGVKGIWTGTDCTVIRWAHEWEQIEGEEKENLKGRISAQNLAYVIYTSGSSGRPKGVMITHGGLANYLQWSREAYGMRSLVGAPVHTSISFDLTVTSLYGALLGGGRARMIAPGLGVEKLKEKLEESREKSLLKLTPAHLEAVGEGAAGGVLVLGGEALRYESLERLGERRGTRIINEYGPTETVVGCCVYEVGEGDQRRSGGVPIGRPIANTEIYVLDEEMGLSPVGVVGEIHIGGSGLGRGYWKAGGMTGQAFVPHPYSEVGGARLYRSGDLGRYRQDGVIEYVGRTDQQVKIRGYRIELGEVEAALAACAGVTESVVVVKEEEGDKRLVAYVVLARDRVRRSGKDLKEELLRKLPEYMVPGVVVELERMPLTENGKIDREALPDAEPVKKGEYVAPRTATEEVLAQLWSEVLKVDRVGVQDNFFDLGGHSLLAMHLMSRVQETFRVDIPLRRLFDHWTLEGFGQLVSEALAGGAVWSGPIPRRSPEEKRKLSYAQQRLLFLNQLEPHNSFYNVATAVKFEGYLDTAALARSLNEVVRRHEVLRTRFVMGSDGQPEQEVIEGLEVQLLVQEVEGEDQQEKWKRAAILSREEVQKPFDLWTGPLLRAQLLHMDPKEHVALLTMHHIVSDQWSMGVLIEEIGEAYRAYSRSEKPQLQELPIQYGDYAAWQREWLQGEVLEKQLAYWRKQLEGMNEALELPADHLRPATQSYRGAHYTARLDVGLGQRLQELARRENVTLFMLITATFQALLWRYTGQPDIAVGTPIANRMRHETERLIGFFLNTLVLRMQFHHEETFRESLKRVREVALGAFAHHDVPFEKLVEELKPERNLGRSPLFQVLVSVENAPPRKLALPGITMVGLEEQSANSKFDLSLFVSQEESGGLEASLEYSTDLFEMATTQRLWLHWEVLLQEVVADPDVSLMEISLLNEAERTQIVDEWNQTRTRYEAKNLVELFEEQVARIPGTVAVEFQGEELSYAVLNRRANQLGRYLRKLGVGPEVLVGICMERSVEMVVGLLGILKAGGAYVPLDPGYPPERLQYMAEDSGVSVMLVHEPVSGVFSGASRKLVHLDKEWEQVARESTENLEQLIQGENLAYVIYTSGSTGRPKGAMNRHHGISNRIQWMQQAYGLGDQDRVLQKTPFSFDVSVWEFFWPLTTGARLVVARPGGHQDSAYLVELVRQRGITTMHFVPSMLHAFVEEPGLEKCASLRRVICSGEALAWELQERFFDRLKHAELHNLYGPTEAAVDVTYWQCEPGSSGRRVPLGRPIGNLKIYILDEGLQPVPIGVTGEIYIAGAGLARGYLNKPALTAERFIACPLTDAPGEQMYKTGDLGRYLSNGVIEYLGRTDHQVKIRGFRIELGEIESVLLRHPEIEQAVVIARTEKNGDKRLVGYVVPKSGARLNASGLRGYLKASLPEYMAPGAWRFLEQMPLTPNGKVDHRNLPPPEIQKQEYVAPRNETEVVLARVWSKVLAITEVGVHDNFFALGGDSIHSLQVIALAKAQGLDFSLPQLFRSPTVAGLAQETAIKVTDDSAHRLTQPFSMLTEEDRRNLPEGIEDAYPLAVMQAGMMYIMDLTPDAPVYHNVDSIHLRARFDLPIFRKAVQASADRHAHLRTSFDMTGFSEPLQLVHRQVTIPIGYTDIRGSVPEEQVEAVRKFTRDEQHRTHHFDLTRPPLMRLHIHQQTDDTFQLTITEAHPIQDGWSLHLVLTEIFTRYFQLLEGQDPPPLPPLKTSYRDFVYLERLALNSEQTRNYWKEQMHECTIPQIPQLATMQDPNSGPQTEDLHLVFSLEISQSLKQLAADLGVPVKSLYLASQLRVLSLITGQTDVVTGLTTNGRLEVDDGELVGGLFLNNAPFRAKLDGGSWRHLIRRTFESEMEMLPHRRYPVAQVHRDHGWRRLFDTAFNYTHFHVTKGILESGNVEVLDALGLDPSDLTLYVQFEPHYQTGQLTIGLHYDSTKISPAQTQRIGDYFLQTLQKMVANPDEDYRSVSLLPEVERKQLLVEWNDTAAEYSLHVGLAELFARQAIKTPNSIALTDENEQVTYAHLERRASQLARYLQKSTTGRQSLVGICMERSVPMVVGLLGILKAGGVYVPLDPGYPRDRLNYMVTNAGLKTIITTQAYLDKLPAEAGAHAICLDLQQEQIAQEPDNALLVDAEPEDLAYVIYTSGSTGKPKGVMATHRAVTNRLEWMWQSYPFGNNEICCLKTTLNFVDSVAEIFGPLLKGIHNVILPEDVVKDPEALVTWLKRSKVTRLLLVPSLLRAVLNRYSDLQSEVPDLKMLVTSGEALSPELRRQCQSALPQVTLLNLYGSSEVSADVTWCELSNYEGSIVPIGRPIFNSRIYVVDENLQLTPTGATGELCVSGAGLARGYLNQPGLTAEKFVPDPFAQQGGRLYRTGDLARWLEDGNLEYMGRLDHQVKIRGSRIELGEVEAALREHHGVEQAAVSVHHADEDVRLVAYVVKRTSADEFSARELRLHLQGRLPDYMVPAAMVFLPVLPLLPNGKLDRNALPSPDGTSRERSKEYVAPRDEVEEILALMWQEVLQLNQIGVYDNFFELGGHSLLIARVMLRVRALFRIEVPLRSFFGLESPTVAGLAHLLFSKEPQPGYVLQVARAMTRINSLSEVELTELANLENEKP